MHILHVDPKPCLIKIPKQSAISKFVNSTNKMYGTKFRIESRRNMEQIHLADDYYKTNNQDDWMPQFAFYFLNDKHGVWLKALRFPEELRNKGLGRHCVNWLVDFCSKYGYKYILLGAIESAEGFWFKMGFKPLPDDETEKYYY